MCAEPILSGVEYRYSPMGRCHQDHRWGYWTPGKICYSDEISLRHEECHEEKYRAGLTRYENAVACGDKLSGEDRAMGSKPKAPSVPQQEDPAIARERARRESITLALRDQRRSGKFGGRGTVTQDPTKEVAEVDLGTTSIS